MKWPLTRRAAVDAFEERALSDLRLARTAIGEWQREAERAHSSAERFSAVTTKLADALERERERYHALASALVPKASVTPIADAIIDAVRTTANGTLYGPEVPPAVFQAINRVSSGDQRLQARLWSWAALPEQRERMQTPTGLAGVVDEIIRGRQRSA